MLDINTKNFEQNINAAMEMINLIPASETKYYFFILINTLKSKNDLYSHKILDLTLQLIDAISCVTPEQFRAFSEQELIENVYKPIFKSFESLKNISNTYNLSAKLGRAILNIATSVTAVLCGFAGAIIGGIAGFIRNIYPKFSIGSGFAIGFFAGLAFGATVGFRLPKKPFISDFKWRLRIGMDGIATCLNNLEDTLQNKHPSFSQYLEEVCDEFKAEFPDNKAFNEFLKNDCRYTINTYKATFVNSNQLKGYVGHHIYVKIDINNKQEIIEYNTGVADTEEPCSQQEERTVKGIKLLEMIALHRKLKETNTPSIKHALHKMEAGVWDCHSYINTILIGTNQEFTSLTRFAHMNIVGRAIGYTVDKLSPFPGTFFKHEVPSAKENSNDCECETILST